MKTNQLIGGMVLGMLLMTAPMLASAQRGPDGFRKHNPQARMHARGMADQIPNLTDEQKTEISKIKTAAQKDILPLRNQVAEKDAHLNTLSVADNVNMKAVNTTIDEISKLKADISKRRMVARQEIRKLLTDEQRVAFDSRPMGRGGKGMYRGRF